MLATSTSRILGYGCCGKLAKTFRGSLFQPYSRCLATEPNTRLEPSQANNLMDIGIRKIFNEEHDIFRESTRKFLKEEMLPNMDRYEKQGYIEREFWEAVGSQGLLSLMVPPEYGGAGADWLYDAVSAEELAYINDPGHSFQGHSNLGTPYIVKYGTEEHKQKFLPDVVAGKKIIALAMTEPHAGSDLQGIRTHVKKVGDDWILNGSKSFITNGGQCDLAVVLAVTDQKAKSTAHGSSLFLVEATMPGFNRGSKLHKLGTVGHDTADLFFDDIRLSRENLLGEENKGFVYLMETLPRERITIAELSMANCEYMFELTREYVKQRKAFGRTISSLQTIQHKLAEMKTNICIARSFMDTCIERLARGDLDAVSASMAKYYVSDLENKVAYDCVQLHGGMGYMWEYPIARSYANARVTPIYGGTNEIMKEVIARPITKK